MEQFELIKEKLKFCKEKLFIKILEVLLKRDVIKKDLELLSINNITSLDIVEDKNNLNIFYKGKDIGIIRSKVIRISDKFIRVACKFYWNEEINDIIVSDNIEWWNKRVI